MVTEPEMLAEASGSMATEPLALSAKLPVLSNEPLTTIDPWRGPRSRAPVTASLPNTTWGNAPAYCVPVTTSPIGSCTMITRRRSRVPKPRDRVSSTSRSVPTNGDRSSRTVEASSSVRVAQSGLAWKPPVSSAPQTVHMASDSAAVRGVDSVNTGERVNLSIRGLLQARPSTSTSPAWSSVSQVTPPTVAAESGIRCTTGTCGRSVTVPSVAVARTWKRAARSPMPVCGVRARVMTFPEIEGTSQSEVLTTLIVCPLNDVGGRRVTVAVVVTRSTTRPPQSTSPRR